MANEPYFNISNVYFRLFRIERGVEIWVIGHYCVKISIRIHLQSVKLKIDGMKRDVEIRVIGHYCINICIKIHLHSEK